MGNSLIATSALAFAGALAAGPALAADKLSVGVGGYMQQWFGMSSVDDTDKSDEMISDGVAQQSDSEIFFRGKLESDSGLTFSVKVELEGNNSDGATAIDESQLTVGGSFGQITLGAEDPASTLTHHGGLDVGISLNCGDTHKWIGGLAGCSHNGFGTYGHGHGDKNQIMYFSPRVSGVQFGASYIPDISQEGSNNALNANAKDAWSVGGNYVGDFGGAKVAFSLGHYQRSQVGAETSLFDGRARGALPTRTAAWHENLAANVANFAMVKDAEKKLWDGTTDADTETAGLQPAADEVSVVTVATAGDADPDEITDYDAARLAAQDSMDLLKAQQSMAVKADDMTFSNVALQVGFGSFNFGVVYAANDGGAYEVETRTVDEQGTPTPNDATDDAEYQVLVEDPSKNWDTWGAGVKYTDGPMAMSLSHLATEWDDGGEQAATMLSLSYTLAPGVASKSSVFTAERDMADGRSIEGTGFVTGITIGF